MAQKLSYAERVRNVHISSSSSSSLSSVSTATTEQPELSSVKQLPPPPPSKPVVNVWNLRMEKMAARAAQKNPSPPSPVEQDRDDPFVVRMPEHLRPLTTATATAGATPVEKKGKSDSWPEVGKASDVIENVSGNNSSPRKTEKFKWVSIPKEELQAAADAASAPKRHSRRSSQHPPSTTTSTTTSINGSASSSTTNSSVNPQSTPSAQTSASHSRSVSLQSSPKTSRNGKKLSPEPDGQLTSNGGNAKSGNESAPVQSKDLEISNESDPGARHHRHRPSQSQTRSQLPVVSHSASGLLAQSTAPASSHQLPPFHATAPVFYPQDQQNDINHASTPNNSRGASSSSSPHIHQAQPLPPSTSGQSLYPSLVHGRLHHTNTPYPLYNLNVSVPYNFPPGEVSHYPSCVPPPSNSTALHHYGPPGSGPLVNGSSMPPAAVNSPPMSTTKGVDPPAPLEKMVFGSIDVPPSEEINNIVVEEVKKEDNKEKEKKKIFIAIGIENRRDVPSRIRSAQKKMAGSGKAGGWIPPSGKDKEGQKGRKMENERDEERKGSTAKWQFGTTTLSSPPSATSPLPSTSGETDAQPEVQHEVNQIVPSTSSYSNTGSMPPCPPDSQDDSSLLGLDSYARSSSSVFPPTHHHIPQHPHHQRMPSSSSTSAVMPLPPLSIPMQASMSIGSLSSDPDLEVKNFGYGFGDAGGAGYAPILVKERAREWEVERERERDRERAATSAAAELGWQEPLGPGILGLSPEEGINSTTSGTVLVSVADRDVGLNGQIQPREQTHQRDHHHGRGGGQRRGGYSNGRGGYSDRGSGTGGYHRGRGGINGYPKGYGKVRGGGNYPNSHNRGGLSPVISRGGVGGPPSPYNATPPHHIQALPIDSSNSIATLPSPLAPPPPGGYYYPHHPNPGRPYLPPGYDNYLPSPPIPPPGVLVGHSPSAHPYTLASAGGQGQPVTPQGHTSKPHMTPPVPVPMTLISFPIDSTRYYLLGQLEYYLSPQNMAQDLYLRQQMDARGWIPISLIASFNRVRQLTNDVHLVRDVLTLSNLVEVRGNMVRMSGWERFVLPDAAPSTVEEQPLPYPYQNLYYYPENFPLEGGAGTDYSELLRAPQVERRSSANQEGGGGGVELYHSGIAPSTGNMKRGMPNGHSQVVDDEEEDEIEFVIGQDLGTFMYDRRTS